MSGIVITLKRKQPRRNAQSNPEVVQKQNANPTQVANGTRSRIPKEERPGIIGGIPGPPLGKKKERPPQGLTRSSVLPKG